MTRYFSIVLSLLLAVSCVFLPVASARQQQHQPLDRIVAVVDDNVVLKSELDRAIYNVKSQYVGHEGQLPPDEVLQRQVLTLDFDQAAKCAGADQWHPRQRR